MNTSEEMQQVAVEYHIDLSRLHREWQNQPQMMINAVARAAACERDHALLKAEQRRLLANLRNDIRTHPKSYGFEKATETGVEDAAVAMPEYRVAEQRTIEARYAMDVAYGHVNAVQDRKKALEKLVDLWLREYFSEPLARGTESAAAELGRQSVVDRMIRKSTEESGS